MRKIFYIILIFIAVIVFSLKLNQVSEKKEKLQIKYILKPSVLKILSLGNEELLADILWLDFIQIYGYHIQNQTKFYNMDLILNAIITVDPYFLHAYTFGSLSLAYHTGKYKEAEMLIWKGILNNPDKWEYLFWYGFLNYTVFKRYFKAGKFFWLASLKKGAPDMTKRWAAFVFYKKVGDLKLSLYMWENLYNTTKNPFEKEVAKNYIERIKKRGGHVF